MTTSLALTTSITKGNSKNDEPLAEFQGRQSSHLLLTRILRLILINYTLWKMIYCQGEAIKSSTAYVLIADLEVTETALDLIKFIKKQISELEKDEEYQD